jgi:N-methylhydantoinase A/oxoprolinase/acetone carboxylase beta subunit
LSESQQTILKRLEGPDPVALETLFRETESRYLLETQLERLSTLGYIAISGFTPTDAAHVLDLHRSWSREAAVLGAELMLRLRAGEGNPGTGGNPDGPAVSDAAQQLCREVIRRAVLQAGRAVSAAVLAERYDFHLESFPAVRELFVDRALAGVGDGGHALAGATDSGQAHAGDPELLGVALQLNQPLVAIGAPVGTYFPDVARSLRTRLVIPQHAEVANAVGAVVGSIMQTVRELITPQENGEVYRVHCEDGVHDFGDLEEAAAFALQAAEERAVRLAVRAGAVGAGASAERQDQHALVAGEQLFIQSVVTATATGRPHLAHDPMQE